MSVNPLSDSKGREFFGRFELSGWWLRYNRGLTYEALLKDRIIQLGIEAGLQDRWLKRILRHAVSEFAKKGLGPDYYGYHNIDHELEAAYFTLLSASGSFALVSPKKTLTIFSLRPFFMTTILKRGLTNHMKMPWNESCEPTRKLCNLSMKLD
jgi:hypothetical protein